MYAVLVGTVNEVLLCAVEAVTTWVSVTLAGLLLQRLVPLSEIQPLVSEIPLPKVEVAVVEVTLSAVVWMPVANVEVAKSRR